MNLRGCTQRKHQREREKGWEDQVCTKLIVSILFYFLRFGRQILLHFVHFGRHFCAKTIVMKSILVMLGTILAVHLFSSIIASLLHLYVMTFLKIILRKKTKLGQKRKGQYIQIVMLLVRNLETKDLLPVHKKANLHRFSLYDPKLVVHDLNGGKSRKFF